MNKNNPQLDLKNQLCFPLYAASRKIVNLYTPLLKELQITYTEYLVFLVLWEKDDIYVSDICDRLYLDNGTITPLLKKLENVGFITRTRSKTDERKVSVSLTKKGKELEEKAKNIPESIAKCMSLEVDEAKTLYSVLYKILNN